MKASLRLLDQKHGDLGYVLKYKETKKGETLTVKVGQRLSHELAAEMNSFVKNAKALKAMCPEDKKDA